MCLFVDKYKYPEKEPFITKRNKTCYKVLKLLDNNTLKTPYRDILVDNNTLIASSFQIEPYEYVGRCLVIYQGIHSFQNLAGAIHEKALLETSLPVFDPTQIVIKEAIIPKGTKYWIGTQGDYCSEKIILKKTIEKCV